MNEPLRHMAKAILLFRDWTAKADQWAGLADKAEGWELKLYWIQRPDDEGCWMSWLGCQNWGMMGRGLNSSEVGWYGLMGEQPELMGWFWCGRIKVEECQQMSGRLRLSILGFCFGIRTSDVDAAHNKERALVCSQREERKAKLILTDLDNAAVAYN